ncbi:TIGR01244 family sulfur transferase [Sphingomonas sp. LB-2]|uniref:TIGR01244 family sulfur transferase n=1 Tax=Sphingomonas caeni TaxID=2984949 RepID=UPI002231BA93|nr:TIGR01244 family sulfur transferase [Sphingomonas caeni]MCW3846724.1 TIGR01244 family sulfur transferase [Sphingomonas caeni]
MTDIRRIDDRISVAPQISPEDVAEIAARGFAVIVNNRPDGEETGQPDSDAIGAAARAAGLAYYTIPVVPAGFHQSNVESMAGVMAEAKGPVLAYCRSGTRSCNLWALAEASKGGDPETLVQKGAGAGYDLSAMRPVLETLSQRA